MAGLFSIALTGLSAAQAGLSTTGHNITNASVSGYNRQTILQGTNNPLEKGSGFYGQGTNVQTVTRVYSDFLTGQVLAANSSVNSFQTYYNEVKQLDNVLGDDTAGLNTALNGFFTGVSQVAASPSSVSARQSMLSNSQALVTRLHTLQQNTQQLQHGVETQISQTVSDINALSSQIADANLNIIKAQAGTGHNANDLLDARDELINKLSKLVKVSTTTDGNGVTSVAIGSGQSLVEGISSYQLVTSPSTLDATQFTIGIKTASGNSVTIPDSLITGGSLGGLLNSRTEYNYAQNSLGRIATSIVSLVNAQNKLGQDLTGVMGGNYFKALSPTVQNLPNTLTGTQSTSSITGTITSVAGLTTSDYVLSYDGTNYSLTEPQSGSVVYTGTSLPGQTVTRQAGTSAATVSISATANATGSAQDSILAYDGTKYTVTSQSSGAVLYSDTTPPSSVDGIAITITGAMTAGDSFLLQPAVAGISLSGTMSAGDQVLIQPTKNAARDISMAITDTSLIAAASPVVVASTKTNSGTGVVSQPTAVSLNGILSPAAAHIATPITMTFNSTTNQFTVTGATPSTIAFDPTTQASGQKITLNNPNLTFTISGRPSNGDSFTISTNVKGTTDSSNANAIYGLMSSKALLDGTATLSGAYNQLVGAIATETSSANVSVETQKSLLNTATAAQQGMSGVNLDEEAASLLEYQQAYQASARCISVAQTLFDDILSVMR